MAVNQDKLNAFMGKAVGDIGAAMSANMVLIGDKLGLYKAMAKMGAVTPVELAKATKTTERYVREGLGIRLPAAISPTTRKAVAIHCPKNRLWRWLMRAVPAFSLAPSK